MKRLQVLCSVIFLGTANAEPPDVEYIFPAGGQLGSTVKARVGGCYFHGSANFEMHGQGVNFQPVIKSIETIWFEGPMIRQPLSSRKETYPKDHLAEIQISKDAQIGHRLWRCWTSQGITRSLKFIIGDLPEITESEINGRPLPQKVSLPITINGRIFPREDVDLWTFDVKKGETITCDASAKRFGSPLSAVLSIEGPDGNPLSIETIYREGDPVVWFKAQETGLHKLKIHDAKFWGLQNHVYRLTIKKTPHVIAAYPMGGRRGHNQQVELIGSGLSKRKATVSLRNSPEPIQIHSVGKLGQVRLQVGENPEHLEPQKVPLKPPVVLNGRILVREEVDEWQIQVDENDTLELDLIAQQFGSPLDAVLEVQDPSGKRIGFNDDREKKQADPKLEFKAKDSGIYKLLVSERFESRGGSSFVYRLHVNKKPMNPDFSLSLAANHFNFERSSEALTESTKATGAKLRVNLIRKGGFKDEVQLTTEGLPAGVKVLNSTIGKNKNFTDLQFLAPPKTKIGVHRVKILGTGNLEDRNVTRTAIVPEGYDRVLLGITPPVPFKHRGKYLFLTGIPSGSTYFRPYGLERGGFKGSLTARLADKQIRHLQGVNDRIIEIPDGAKDFRFPVALPPKTEIGRTSRVQIMLVGEMTDFDKTRHIVSYTSSERDDQFISVPSSGLVSLDTPNDTFALPIDGKLIIPVTVKRAPPVVDQRMLVEILQPDHVSDISCEPVELDIGKQTAILTVNAAQGAGPLNSPFRVSARTLEGPRHVAEKKIEFVVPIR